MKFLIDADSPRSLVEIFKKHGHAAVHVRDVLGSATDEQISEYARKDCYVIVTRDLGFAHEFINLPRSKLRGICWPHPGTNGPLSSRQQAGGYPADKVMTLSSIFTIYAPLLLPS